jgi:hypothetical protein
MALPITSAGRFRPWGPLGIVILLLLLRDSAVEISDFGNFLGCFFLRGVQRSARSTSPEATRNPSVELRLDLVSARLQSVNE